MLAARSFHPTEGMTYPEFPPTHDACVNLPDLVRELSKYGPETDVVFTVADGDILHIASLKTVQRGCGVVAVNLELSKGSH